jgi:hypothetical protein
MACHQAILQERTKKEREREYKKNDDGFLDISHLNEIMAKEGVFSDDCNWFFPSFVSYIYVIDSMIISKMDALTMSLPSRTGTCHHIELPISSPYCHGKGFKSLA